MKLWVGTSGYSYKEWKGNFYPEKFPNKDMLSYYAQQLTSVEINNTFYRMPKENVLESWAGQVPDGFRFSIKASRRITHIKRLKETSDETEYLFRVLGALGERLGVVLFQLPPNMKKDVDRLNSFLELIPEGAKVAFEFRHESWFDGDVFDRLGEEGHTLVVAEDDENQAQLVSTTDWGYLRLRKSEYADKDLKKWAKQLGSQKWKQAFVFFRHEDTGIGPKLATRFIELTGN